MSTNFEVSCNNPDCHAFKKTFNSFEIDFEDESYEQSFLESFGHGGEDVADYCPHCKELGLLEFAEEEVAS